MIGYCGVAYEVQSVRSEESSDGAGPSQIYCFSNAIIFPVFFAFPVCYI